MIRRSLLLLASASVAGCASLPPATVNYYLPRADLEVQVARSIACSTDDKIAEAAKVISSKVTYSADTTAGRKISVRDFRGDLANTEVGLTLTEDGRLSSINTTQSGQGSEILEAAIAVAGLAVGLADDQPASVRTTACDYVRNNGKDGVLTLTYVVTEPFNSRTQQPPQAPALVATEGPGPRPIGVITADQEHLTQLQPVLTQLCFVSTGRTNLARRIEYERGTRKDILVKLRDPLPVDVSILPGSRTDCATTDKEKRIWGGSFMVPQFGQEFDLPIPPAPAFGKQVVKVTLSDSGAITGITYGEEQGASAVLGTVGKAITEFQADTSAAKAAEIKAQADIIAQQERLVACRASPSTCPRS